MTEVLRLVRDVQHLNHLILYHSITLAFFGDDVRTNGFQDNQACARTCGSFKQYASHALLFKRVAIVTRRLTLLANRLKNFRVMESTSITDAGMLCDREMILAEQVM